MTVLSLFPEGVYKGFVLFPLKCFTEFTSEATWACSFLYENICDYKLNFTKCPKWTGR